MSDIDGFWDPRPEELNGTAEKPFEVIKVEPTVVTVVKTPTTPSKTPGEAPKKKFPPNLVLTEVVKEKIRELYGKGYTNAEVAKLIGVRPKSIHRHRNRDKGFDIDCREAMRLADDLVERALFKKATGTSVKRVKNTEDGKSYEIIEELPPDTAALTFWLSHRRSQNWANAAQNAQPVQILNIFNPQNEKKDKIER